MVEMGNVWDRSAEFVSDNLAAILPIALVVMFVPTVIYTNLWGAMAMMPIPGRVVAGIALLLFVIIGSWGQLIVTALALDLGSGREARAIATRRLPATLLVALAVGVAFLLISILGSILLYFAGMPLDPEAVRSLPLERLLPLFGVFMLFLLVLFPIMIWLLARLAVLTPVIVNEDVSIGAFARSYRLTRGIVLKIIGVGLLYLIVANVAQLAVQLVVGSLLRLATGGGGPLSLSSLLTSTVVVAVQTGFSVMATVFAAKLYQALVYSHAIKNA